ncbi:MAG TPA: hypothetical protein VFW71_08585 [Actinomycetota bacterium]|nr:hypothetical protein [Actinomycetota bacterium]
MRRWVLSSLLAFGILLLSVVLPAPPAPTSPAPAPPLSPLSRAQAVAAAENGGTQPATARLVSYRSAAQLLGRAPDPAEDPGAQVWLVTVRQPQTYTVILNQADGRVIDSCLQCWAA